MSLQIDVVAAVEQLICLKCGFDTLVLVCFFCVHIGTNKSSAVSLVSSDGQQKWNI